MSGADDDYDPQLDGKDGNLLAPSAYDAAENFVYQSLNNDEGGDAEQYNISGDFNGAAMNEPEESADEEELLCPLTNIWDCSFIIKCTAVSDGHSYAGWKCGFCPRKPDGSEANPFHSQNVTKALCHVAKIKGYDIRACRGFIPPGMVQQYRMLYQSKAADKDQWQQNRQTIASNISNLQDQMLHSLAATSRLGGRAAL